MNRTSSKSYNLNNDMKENSFDLNLHRGFGSRRKQPDFEMKKKILVERNETDCSTTPGQLKSVLVPNASEISPFSLMISQSKQNLKSSETFAPYDPLINFTSPRPEFLRYDPNRRKEILRRIDMERKREEDELSDSSECWMQSSDGDDSEFEQFESEIEMAEMEKSSRGCGMLWNFVFLFGILVSVFWFMSSEESSSVLSLQEKKLVHGNGIRMDSEFLLELSGTCSNVCPGEGHLGFDCSKSSSVYTYELLDEIPDQDLILGNRKGLAEDHADYFGDNGNSSGSFSMDDAKTGEDHEFRQLSSYGEKGPGNDAFEVPSDSHFMDVLQTAQSEQLPFHGVSVSEPLEMNGQEKKQVSEIGDLNESLSYRSHAEFEVSMLLDGQSSKEYELPVVTDAEVDPEKATGLPHRDAFKPNHLFISLGVILCGILGILYNHIKRAAWKLSISYSPSPLHCSFDPTRKEAQENADINIEDKAYHSDINLLPGGHSDFETQSATNVAVEIAAMEMPNLLNIEMENVEDKINQSDICSSFQDHINRGCSSKPSGTDADKKARLVNADKGNMKDNCNRSDSSSHLNSISDFDHYGTKPPAVKLLGEFSLVDALAPSIDMVDKVKEGGALPLYQYQRKRSIRSKSPSSANKVYPSPPKSIPSKETASNGSLSAQQKATRKEDSGKTEDVGKELASPLRRSSRLHNRAI